MLLDKRKHHTRFGTANKRELYFQDGRLFCEQGKPLPHDLEKVQRLGYQVTNDIRDMFVQQALAEEKAQRLREVEEQLELRRVQIEEEWKQKVRLMNEDMVAAEIAPPEEAPAPLVLAPLELSPQEMEAAQLLERAAETKVAAPPKPPLQSRMRTRPSRAKVK